MFNPKRIGSLFAFTLTLATLTGCATRGDLRALTARVATNQADHDALKTTVATNATSSSKALEAATKRLEALDKASDDNAVALAKQGKQLDALETTASQHATKAELAAAQTAMTEQAGKIAVLTTAVGTKADKDAVAKLEAAAEGQARLNKQLATLLRAHRRGDKITFSGIRVALGDKAPSGVVECWGFSSGQADLGRVLEKSPGCKKGLDRLAAEVKADKAEVVGIVGNHDTRLCKKWVPECLLVAKRRANSVAQYLRLPSNGALVSVEEPTAELGDDARNRAVHVFWRLKPPPQAKQP